MHPELEKRFEEAAPAPTAGPDVGSIVAGGRRLRVWRRARVAATVMTIVALVGLSVPMLIDGLAATDPEREPISPATPGPDAEPFRESKPDDRPAYIDRQAGQEQRLVGEKEVVASGVVLDEPWSMVEVVTIEQEEGTDSLSHCVEFFLGRNGRRGSGGGNCATVNPDDSAITLAALYWGDVPDLVAVIGSIAEPAVTARVELADGRSRAIEIFPSSKDDTIGWYAFFPPPFVDGEVVAYDADGQEVGRKAICFPIRAGAESGREPLPAGHVGGCS